MAGRLLLDCIPMEARPSIASSLLKGKSEVQIDAGGFFLKKREYRIVPGIKRASEGFSVGSSGP